MSNTMNVCRTCMRAAARTSRYQRTPTNIESLSRTSRSHPLLQTSRNYATSTPSTTPSSNNNIADEIGSKATADAHDRAKRMREGKADFTEQYKAQAATETLFKECARQADYFIPEAFDNKKEVPKNDAGEDIGQGTGWWYEDLGLTPTFNTWAQVTFLHMYLLTVRIRYFPASYAKIWNQHLLDHFFYEAEHRMNIFHKMESKALRQRYLKQIFDQWRGVIQAYDEGLIKGDAVLGAAVWRNIFKASDEADWVKVAMIVSYMRRALRALDNAPDKRIIEAMVRFGTPAAEVAQVEQESKGMTGTLAEGETEQSVSSSANEKIKA